MILNQSLQFNTLVLKNRKLSFISTSDLLFFKYGIFSFVFFGFSSFFFPLIISEVLRRGLPDSFFCPPPPPPHGYLPRCKV